MGTGTSRIRSDTPSGRLSLRQNSPSRLSSLLICGCTSSHLRARKGKDHFRNVKSSSSGDTRIFDESISERNRATESSNMEMGTSSSSSDLTSAYAPVSLGLTSANVHEEGRHLKKYEEFNQSNHMSVEIDHGYSRNASGTAAGTSFREEQSSDFVVITKEPNIGTESSVMEDDSVLSNVIPLVSSIEMIGVNESQSHAGLVSTSSSNDYLQSSSSHVSSFSDTISSNSPERLTEDPNANFTSENREDALSQGTRLLVSNDGFPVGGIRVNNGNEHRPRSRSEIWDILFGSNNENQRQNNLCPFGVHSEGSCSCYSFLTGEESTIHLSISRIVMLAEALFEVLDEIEPRAAAFPLPSALVAAPGSVVDSFPVREHKKPKARKPADETQQCYICLSEYEEGDKIRSLPCHHEYHVTCVDKWLKEIHGVCPLCRGDVSMASTSTC